MQLVSQPSIAVARTGVLHCAMGLSRKTATEEDRREDNKDSDWLIEQSVRDKLLEGWLHCATAMESLQSLQKVELSSTKRPSPNLGDGLLVLLRATLRVTRNVARQVAD